MFDPKFFEECARKIRQALPPALKDVPEDWEKNVRAVLQGTFNKLDLVTREEFDAQAEVLARTREKLEEMERELAKLEKQVKPKSPPEDNQIL